MKALLILCLGLMACSTPHETMARFKYSKDPRTNTCFVLYGLDSNMFSMSYVPCTPEVEKAIQEDARK